MAIFRAPSPSLNGSGGERDEADRALLESFRSQATAGPTSGRERAEAEPCANNVSRRIRTRLAD